MVRAQLEGEINTWLEANKPSGVKEVLVRLVEHPGRGYKRVAGRVEDLDYPDMGRYRIVVSTLGGKSEEKIKELVQHELRHIKHYVKHRPLYEAWEEDLPAVESFLRAEISGRGRLSAHSYGNILIHLYDHYGLESGEGWKLIKKVLKDMSRHLDTRIKGKVEKFLKEYPGAIQQGFEG